MRLSTLSIIQACGNHSTFPKSSGLKQKRVGIKTKKPSSVVLTSQSMTALSNALSTTPIAQARSLNAVMSKASGRKLSVLEVLARMEVHSLSHE